MRMNNATDVKEHYNKYLFTRPNESAIQKFLQDEELLFGLVRPEELSDDIIDLGCGTGRILKLLELSGKRKLTGIDFSTECLKSAKENLKYTKLKEMDVTDLSEIKEQFETVICFGVAHHTTEPKKVFKECVRLCKTNGMILYGVSKKYSIRYYDYILLNRFVKFLFRNRIVPWSYPLFKLWFFVLNKRWVSDKQLVIRLSDRYLNPIIKFSTVEQIERLCEENNVWIEKINYDSSLICLLIRKCQLKDMT
ncbi:hypothetical protein LCGC14_1732700 [marine sediment metagenome]|uniref:Methyltransferase type 11 domain-containing protein n=1 Tax=marine sediment metagenome TaxID=412755 RepID=A0A0F9HWQ6_9ZZZZ